MFPSAKHQACWTHLCRNVMKYVRAKDKSTVMNELKLVYNAASPAEAESILYDFIVKYSKISNVEPSVRSSFQTKILLKDMFAAFIATITRQCTVVYIKALKNAAPN